VTGTTLVDHELGVRVRVGEPDQPDAGLGQDRVEDHAPDGERGERRRTGGDEDRPDDRRGDGPDWQHALVVGPRHGELAHDDDHDDGVVDRGEVSTR
jgi:hypothetical protein